jgi:hypothetical protein
MRILVEVNGKDQELLERAALRERRPIRDQAAFLLHQKLQEEAQRGKSESPVAKAS